MGRETAGEAEAKFVKIFVKLLSWKPSIVVHKTRYCSFKHLPESRMSTTVFFREILSICVKMEQPWEKFTLRLENGGKLLSLLCDWASIFAY